MLLDQPAVQSVSSPELALQKLTQACNDENMLEGLEALAILNPSLLSRLSQEERLFALKIAANFSQVDTLKTLLKQEDIIKYLSENNSILKEFIIRGTLLASTKHELLPPDIAFDWNEALDFRATLQFRMLNVILEVPELHNSEIDTLIEQMILANFRMLEQFDIPVMAAALGWAAGHGHQALVSWLLERGPHVRQLVRYNGSFAFKNAADNKHFSIVKQFLEIPIEELLKEGEKEDLKNWDYSENKLDIIHCLLSIFEIKTNIRFENDCLINWAAKNNFVKGVEHLLTLYPDNENYLHLAAKHGLIHVVSLLIQHGYDVNLVDEGNENTALHLTTSVEVARELINHGANPNIQNFDGETALLRAIFNQTHDTQQESIELINVLIDEGHANVNMPNFYFDDTPLTLATRFNFLATVKKLIKNGAEPFPEENLEEERTTALHEAAERNHAAILRELLHASNNVNVRGINKQTPLHIAALYNSIDAARILITEGNADVNAQDGGGYTPLLTAIIEGNIEFARMLIEDYHANIHIPNARGEMPIILALISDHYIIVELLLEHGAPLSANLKHCIELSTNPELRKACYSSLFTLAYKNLTHILSEALKEFENIVNIRDSTGGTLLHAATSNGRIETVRMLINKGIDVDEQSPEGNTPLYYAIDEGHINLVRILIDEYHANIHMTNGHGQTPIAIAFEGGYHNIVQLLQARGAVLPVNLQEQPQDNLINPAQSTHKASVHESVAESAENLRTLYFTLNKKVEGQVDRLLDSYVDQLFEKYKRINNLVPTDPYSQNLYQRVVKNVPREKLLEHSKVNARKILAMNLKEIYDVEFESVLNGLRKNLLDYIISLHPTDHPHSEIAKRCIIRLLNVDFVEVQSKISLKQALALVWMGINDPHAYAGKTLSLAEIRERRKDFVGFLFEIQRGENLNKNGVDEHPQERDRHICYSGTFNKLMSALDRKHDKVFIIYVTKETITTKSKKLITQYFIDLSMPDKIRYAQSLSSLCKDETIPLELLSHIKKYVNAKLRDEFDPFKNLIDNYEEHIAALIEGIEDSEEILAISASLHYLTKKETVNSQERRIPLESEYPNHSAVNIYTSLKDLLSDPRDEEGEKLEEEDLHQIRRGIALQTQILWIKRNFPKLPRDGKGELLDKDIQKVTRGFLHTAIHQTFCRSNIQAGRLLRYPFRRAKKCTVNEEICKLHVRIKDVGSGMSSKVEGSQHKNRKTLDNLSLTSALKKLEEDGLVLRTKLERFR